jgi:hypothetical protein
MKKTLLSLIMVAAYTNTILNAATIPNNQTYEHLSKEHAPENYYSLFRLVADDLDIDFSAFQELCLRIPKEEICQLNPSFNQMAIIPGSKYIFINPAWFDSLSPEAQRFAAGIYSLGTLKPITATRIQQILMAAETTVLASVFIGTFMVLGKKDLSRLKRGLLAFLAALIVELPIELIAEKKITQSYLQKKQINQINTILKKLNDKYGAIEYYQKFIAGLEPYALYNPSIQVIIDSLKNGLRMVES